MPYAVGNRRCGESHVDQQRDRAMANVMNPNTFNACFLCTPVHLTVKIALCDSEHPVIWLNAIELFQIVLHFICEELRHFYDAVAFLGFGRCDQILPIQALIGFCD